MTELTDLMFQKFSTQFPVQLQDVMKTNKMHQTNSEALHCFVVSMLSNIFQSPVAQRNNLKTGYLASTENLVYFLTVSNGDRPKFDFFVFDLSNDPNKKLFFDEKLQTNLVAMLVGDQLHKLLPGKKLPKANVAKFSMATGIYEVSMIFLKNHQVIFLPFLRLKHHKKGFRLKHTLQPACLILAG